MKKYKLAILLLSLCIAISGTCQSNYQPFVSIAAKGGMNLVKTPSFQETPVVTNDELNYQYAVKDSTADLEVRYLVYPLQDMVKKYNTNKPDSGMPNIDPNFLHTNLLLAYAMKIQGKDMTTEMKYPELKELPHATCEKEFKADWAAEVDIQPCDEFAQKYKYCTMLELHKDNMADAFVIFLYNQKDSFDDLVKPVYHSLTF